MLRPLALNTELPMTVEPSSRNDEKFARIVGATLVVALSNSGSHKGGNKPRPYHE